MRDEQRGIVISHSGSKFLGRCMFELRSTFTQAFPTEYTCDGKNSSPELMWTAPPEAKGYALVVEDPDAPGGTFVHWVAYNIPAGVSHLPPALPREKVMSGLCTQGLNSFGRMGYDGPCPPRGHGAHRYYFRLYALSSKTNLPPGVRVQKLRGEIARAILATTEFMATYSRR
jgi:Raf kinase inhibitor-like YbhB/YbcL family protein